MLQRGKRFSLATVLPCSATVVVLLALWGDRTFLRVAPSETEFYHAAVRSAVQALPIVNGSWVGVDVPVPEAAVQLLHPNIILSRRFQNLSTGESVTLLLVHVRDARDVLGHYPPVCYPGQGWKTQTAEPTDWTDGARVIAGTEYAFERERLEGASHLVVDNFLIMAGGETCRNMDAVEIAAQDRKRKFWGAGQVQFVHDAGTSAQRRREIVEEFLRYGQPVLESIASTAVGKNS